MQPPEAIELAEPSALFNVPLAQCRWSAATAYDYGSRLRFAVLVESVKEKGFRISGRGLADYGLPIFSALCSLVT